MKKAIKLYKVKFNEYTNCLYDTVAKYYDKERLHADYIEIPFGGLIVREDELQYYIDYGNGFDSINCIGSMLVDED